MRIARSMLDEMVAQARDEAPNECCGLVGSRDGHAVKLYKTRNDAGAGDKNKLYVIHPNDLLRAQTDIEDSGLDVGIIYHSHPATEPRPSPTDISLAAYPDAVYVIIGVAYDEIRAWHIRDGQVSEAELDVEED
jgi:proteasome lid subunit RPN8/RPN11